MDVTSSQPEKRAQALRNRRRRKIIGLGLVLLLSGILIGAGGMFFWGRELVLQNIRRGASLASISEHLEKALNLNSTQNEQVEEILKRHVPKIREIRKSKYLEIRQEIDVMRDEIEATLDERQLKLWEEELDRITSYRRYRRHHHRRPSPPDAHPRHLEEPAHPGPGPGPPR
jgi:hypothetical protein